MAQAKEKNPKNVTIYGRLSWPVWTAQAAFDRSQGGKYPVASVDKAKPEFNLLVEQPQLDKLRDFVTSTFFPFCIQQEADGAKKGGLTAQEVADITKQITSSDFGGATAIYNSPFKVVHEKTAPSVPEAVASIKLIGNEGVDIALKAIVNDESELLVPDPEILKFPVVKPIHETVHQMYPGAYVAVTVNLYAYHNGKIPGFSAGASTAVFKADGDRIGGGVEVDLDEIFAD